MTGPSERANQAAAGSGGSSPGGAPPLVARQDPTTGRDVGDIQRRTLRVLMAVVAVGGAGTAGAFSVAAVLAERITGNETLSGLAASGLTIGSALVAVPMAKLMSRSGRRVGLRSGYFLALAGAFVALLGGQTDAYALVVIGFAAVGTGNACTLAARFAVVDLAVPAHRARTIGLLVGATTVGAIMGPTLALGPATTVATAVGLDELSGPYLFAAAAFLLAALVSDRGLRPDPLLVARRLGGGAETARTGGNLARSIRLIFQLPAARLATLAMMVGQGVMVATMVMTPLHMTDGDQSLELIGFVISIHIVGMYALAPLVGWMADRLGPAPMIVAGGAISFGGAEIAAHTPPDVAWGMFVGMFGVGLGWNCCLVAGTALFTAVVPAADRVPVQGAADLLMTASGSVAGVAGGAVVAWQDFQFLSHYSGLFGAALAGVATVAYLRNLGGPPRPATRA